MNVPIGTTVLHTWRSKFHDTVSDRKTIVKLEDLRGGRVGQVALWLPDDALLPAAFHEHANQALWHTINCLLRLAGQPIHLAAASPVIGAIEWWRTIESLIALLYLVARKEQKAGLRSSPQQLPERCEAMDKWSKIARWYSGNRNPPPSQLTGLVTELRDFRNSFEHTSRMSTASRRHSRLATLPAGANEADLMEAMAICLAACGFYRFILPTCDLMPQMVLPAKDSDGEESYACAALDDVAMKVVWPFFTEVLSARNLTSEVKPYPSNQPLQGESILCAKVICRYEDEIHAPEAPAFEAMERLTRLVDGIISPLLPGTFRLPDYGRPLS